MYDEREGAKKFCPLSFRFIASWVGLPYGSKRLSILCVCCKILNVCGSLEVSKREERGSPPLPLLAPFERRQYLEVERMLSLFRGGQVCVDGLFVLVG